MSQSENTLRINVLIDILPKTLQTIVEKEKQAAGFQGNRGEVVDTADKVGELISRFLLKNDFDGFVNDDRNYPKKTQKIV